MGLTGTPPLPPVVLAQAAALNALAEELVPLIAIAPAPESEQLSQSVDMAFQNAAGPGNVLSGIVSQSRPDGTLVLTTQQGAEVTIRVPPELAIPTGSTLAIRIASVGPTPLALILSINGRPVSAGSIKAASLETPQPPPAANGVPAVPANYNGLTTANIGALATSVLANLSRQSGANPAALGPAAANQGQTKLSGVEQAIVATLVQGVGFRRGLSMPPSGTRYRLAITEIAPAPVDNTASEPENENADGLPISQADSAPPEFGDEPTTVISPPQIEADFVEQPATLSGRVIATGTAQSGMAETIVETPLGLLSLPLTDKGLTPGSVVTFQISHAALPQAPDAASAAKLSLAGDSAIEQVATALAPFSAASALLKEHLVFEPDARLAAAILSFIAPSSEIARRRKSAEDTIKEALAALGRGDLSDRFASAASPIARTMPGQMQGQWQITTLPFIGLASTRPAYLYRKSSKGNDAKTDSHRFILDVELKRLGPLQFDGLLRERHFDLMLRTRTPFDSELRALVQEVFHSSLSIGGYAGEMGFGGLIALSTPADPGGLEPHRFDA